MKKIALLLFLCFSTTIMLAQEKVYAEIVGNEHIGTTQITVKVIFGKNSKKFASHILDENGQKITFNTMVDAMNQLAEHGWELENTYGIVDGDYDRVATEFHWIVSRKTKKEEKSGDKK